MSDKSKERFLSSDKTSKKSHLENRSKVCLVCFQKGSPKVMQNAGAAANLKRIQEFFLENYDPTDLKLPNGLCTSCMNKLLMKDKRKKWEKENKEAPQPPPATNKPPPDPILPDPVDFQKLQFPSTLTRSRGGDSVECDCDICSIAIDNPFLNPSKFGKGKEVKPGRPMKELPRLAARMPVSVCGQCFQVIGKGISHPNPCTISDRRLNLNQLSLADPRGRELAASAVIRESAEASGTSSFIPLQTKSGASLNVSIEKPSTSRALFPNKNVPAAELDRGAAYLGLSGKKTNDMAHMFRTWFGRDTFEPNTNQKLVEKRKVGAEFFAIERCEMEVKGEKRGQVVMADRPVFYCKDIPGLFKFVAERRGYHAHTELMQLFGYDKGGQKTPSLKKVVNIKKVVSEFSSPHRKKFSYQAGAFSGKFLDSGVNRTIIIALAPEVLETFHNMHEMTKLLNFSYRNLSNPFDANDILLSPNFVGVGRARSTYPCHYCIMPAKDFNKIEIMLKGGELRTLESIHENATRYQEALKNYKGKVKLSSAPYFNCENTPLYKLHNVDIKTLVLMLMPPPELHILLGLGNDFFDLIVDRLKAKNPKFLDIIHEFLKDFNLEKEVYFCDGKTDFPGTFNGPSCAKFLSLVDKLEEYLRKVQGALETVQPILTAMRAFNNVRKQCFTVDLDPNYKNGIREFAHLWIKCERSITLKCHILFVHVVQFLEAMKDRFPDRGLGWWGEQASESSHHKFENFYEERYKRKLDHPEHDQKLFDCCVAFNEKAYGDERN